MQGKTCGGNQNQPDRCLAIWQALKTKLEMKVLTYHSRFRLCDRAEVHKQTVAAFACQKGKPVERAIAVTTQVCEMSLACRRLIKQQEAYR